MVSFRRYDGHCLLRRRRWRRIRADEPRGEAQRLPSRTLSGRLGHDGQPGCGRRDPLHRADRRGQGVQRRRRHDRGAGVVRVGRQGRRHGAGGRQGRDAQNTDDRRRKRLRVRRRRRARNQLRYTHRLRTGELSLSRRQLWARRRREPAPANRGRAEGEGADPDRPRDRRAGGRTHRSGEPARAARPA